MSGLNSAPKLGLKLGFEKRVLNSLNLPSGVKNLLAPINRINFLGSNSQENLQIYLFSNAIRIFTGFKKNASKFLMRNKFTSSSFLQTRDRIYKRFQDAGFAGKILKSADFLQNRLKSVACPSSSQLSLSVPTNKKSNLPAQKIAARELKFEAKNEKFILTQAREFAHKNLNAIFALSPQSATYFTAEQPKFRPKKILPRKNAYDIAKAKFKPQILLADEFTVQNTKRQSLNLGENQAGRQSLNLTTKFAASEQEARTPRVRNLNLKAEFSLNAKMSETPRLQRPNLSRPLAANIKMKNALQSVKPLQALRLKSNLNQVFAINEKTQNSPQKSLNLRQRGLR